MKIIGCLIMLVACVGCVSTPAKRIQAEPELFGRFPSEVQAKVRKGEVEVGFTKDMVRLALGRPQRIYTRTAETGQVEIWLYMGIRHVNRYEPMDSGYWYRDRSGRLRRSYETIWVDRGYSEEYPTLRLEFSDDKLKVIERLRR